MWTQSKSGRNKTVPKHERANDMHTRTENTILCDLIINNFVRKEGENQKFHFTSNPSINFCSSDFLTD